MSIEFSPVFRGTGASPVQKIPSLHGHGVRATRKKKPLSARRLAANRANARKSTGPRTAAGKRRVSRNALKHGMCAIYGARLPGECEATFEIFLREFEEDLRPVTTMQRVLFVQIANLVWRLQRLSKAQADLFAEELPKTGVKGQTLTSAQILAKRFSDDRNNGFILMDRYERTMRNALLRLLKEFDRLGKRQLPEDPDERVPREGDRPAWTQQKQREQEEAFARRRVEAEQFVPPRDEYEAAIDRANRQRDEYLKQTQSKPTQNVDSEVPEGKCSISDPSPVTKQTHSPQTGRSSPKGGL
jgi:hypothetical protein